MSTISISSRQGPYIRFYSILKRAYVSRFYSILNWAYVSHFHSILNLTYVNIFVIIQTGPMYTFLFHSKPGLCQPFWFYSKLDLCLPFRYQPNWTHVYFCYSIPNWAYVCRFDYILKPAYIYILIYSFLNRAYVQELKDRRVRNSSLSPTAAGLIFFPFLFLHFTIISCSSLFPLSIILSFFYSSVCFFPFSLSLL